MIAAMIFRLPLAGLAAAATLALAGCGPDPTPTSNATPAARTSAASSPTAGTAARFTPQQVCGLVDLAAMSQITGTTIASTAATMSGDVAVCEYRSPEGYGKVFVEWSPNGKTAAEYRKDKAEAVPGLGQAAYWFKTAGQLSVVLGGGQATLEIFMMDTRMHNNDTKGGAIEIAQKVVPGMAHS
jgi:Protein of unknown function (DUF3558)